MAFRIKINFIKQLDFTEIEVFDGERVETVIQKCITYVHSLVSKTSFEGAIYAKAFGLKDSQNGIWLSPEENISARSILKYKNLSFRVRHRPVSNFYKADNFLWEYLFLQLKEDLNLGPLSNGIKEIERLLGLLVISLFVGNTIPIDPYTQVNSEYTDFNPSITNLRNFVSKEVKGRVYPPWYLLPILSKQMKDKFKNYKKENLQLLEYMKNLYDHVIEDVPDYCFEKYDATDHGVDPSREVTVKLQPFDEHKEHIGLFYGQVYQCNLDEIESLELIKPDHETNREWRVVIQVQGKKDVKTLGFCKEGEAESFISGVQGYVTLCIAYDKVVDTTIWKTQNFKDRMDLRSFGPLRDNTVKEKLLEGRSSKKQFLICESAYKFNSFVVKAFKSSDSTEELVELEIEIQDDYRFILHEGSNPQSFGDRFELKSYLAEHFGTQLLPRKSKIKAELNRLYQDQSDIEYYTESSQGQVEVNKQPVNSPVLQEDIHNLAPVQDKNPYVKTYTVQVRTEEAMPHMTLLRVEDTKESDILKAFNDGIARCVKLWRACDLKPNRFVGLERTILNPSLPSILVEHAPLGDLLTFLHSKPRPLHQKLDIMLQMVHILKVMQTNKLYHGNIRCRRFKVFEMDDPNMVMVKLGHPGVSAFYDQVPMNDENNLERYPWLAPERKDLEEGCQQLPEPTLESEIYALGTAFYEILCLNDSFGEQLNTANRDSDRVVDYLKSNSILPLPVSLKDCDESVNALAPAVKATLNKVYQLVKQCWNPDPNQRPDATELLSHLKEITEEAPEDDLETQRDVLNSLMYDETVDKKPAVSIDTQSSLDEFLNKHRGYMIQRKYLHLDKSKAKLGMGHYGSVYEGTMDIPQVLDGLRPQEVKVAVKELNQKTHTSNQLFMKELKTFIDLKHKNVVQLLKFCYNPNGVINGVNLLVMEFLNGGPLLNGEGKGYLQKNRNTSQEVRLGIIEDVAEGMVYLSGKNMVHRDLAARNVLLHIEAGKITAKVADFGLSRPLEKDTQHYMLKRGEALPFYWMPPEFETTFTTKSDVWSFGVLMWETFTGCHPTKAIEMSKQNGSAHLKALNKGWRLPQMFFHAPNQIQINKDVYTLILTHCWDKDQEKRSFFVDLLEEIRKLQTRLLPID